MGPTDFLSGVGLVELTRLLADRTVSATELTAEALRRIEATQPTVNAFRRVRASEAPAEAAEADRRLAAGGWRLAAPACTGR